MVACIAEATIYIYFLQLLYIDTAAGSFSNLMLKQRDVIETLSSLTTHQLYFLI